MSSQHLISKANTDANICLLISNSKNQQLIKRCIDSNHNIFTADQFNDDAEYDLLIADYRAFQEHFYRYKKHRKQKKPEFLPSLVLTKNSDLQDLDKKLWQLIDDVISLPTKPNILSSRIKLLLRTKNYSTELKKGNEEKETLLNEVHHRVKNNLALIKGLLELQGNKLQNKEAEKALKNSRMRIFSISKVHKLLYQYDEFSSIKILEYVKDIIDAVDSTFKKGGLDIHYHLEVENIELSISQAIPCGMIINELLTNSLTHGFPSQSSGKITLTLEESNDRIEFCYQDSGVGLPADFDIKKSANMGFTIIRTLVKQLQAEFTFVESDAQFHMSFEKDNYSGFY